MSRHNKETDRALNAVSQWDAEIPKLKLGPMLVLGRLAEVSQLMQKNHIEPVFKAHKLKPGEFDVLATLRRSGAPFSLTPTQLYCRTMVSSGGMTARLDKLEKAQLIERKSHETDRRALLVHLTEKGKTLIEDMLPGYIDTQHQALAKLSADEQEQLAILLGKLTEPFKAS